MCVGGKTICVTTLECKLSIDGENGFEEENSGAEHSRTSNVVVLSRKALTLL